MTVAFHSDAKEGQGSYPDPSLGWCQPTHSTMNVYGLTSAFTSAVTWNVGQPTLGSLYASIDTTYGGPSGCTSNGWADISGGGASGLTLVDLVQSWANGATNYGLELKAASESDTYSWKKFNSADAGSNVPYLVVSHDSYSDTSDNADGSSWWYSSDSNGMWPTSTTSFDPYGLQHVSRPATSGPYSFRTFTAQDSTTVRLQMFEYDPAPTMPTEYPAVVLVHGGGWKAGSPDGVADIAYELSTGVQSYVDDAGVVQTATLIQPFIVFTIEYRLSCPWDGVNKLCGWHFASTDGGAAISDVEKAIHWVRNKYLQSPGWTPQANVTWDMRNVDAIGASAGGHLVDMAAALGVAGDSRPDAVAGWSGALELTLMGPTPPQYGCESGQSANPDYCWSATNMYLNCPGGRPDPNCVSPNPDIYAAASPIDNYNFSTGPPIFFANGGGPNAGSSPPELIALQEAIDFNGQPSFNVNHRICIVNKPTHATTYLHRQCNDGISGTVLQRTVSFLADNLIPAP